MNSYVYLLVSEDNRVYVGSSQELDSRLKRHRRELQKGKHHNIKLQEYWNIHEALSLTTIGPMSRQAAYTLEQTLMDKFVAMGHCFNIGISVKGGDNLTNHPNKDEVIEKIRNSTNANISKLSDEEKQLIYGHVGEANGMFGKTHSLETRNIISAKLKANPKLKEPKGPFSKEHKAKLSAHAKSRVGIKNPFFGKTHSPETIEKLRLNKIGHVPVNVKPCSILGIKYNSIGSAAKSLGIPVVTVRFRILSKNPKFNDYFYIDK